MQDDYKPPRIRRGRVESVEIYEIKDSELEILEHGTPADIQLNWAVFLLSIAFTCIAALVTADFKYPTARTTFIFIAVVGILGGIYLGMNWHRGKSSTRKVCLRIRERIKETFEPPSLASPDSPKPSSNGEDNAPGSN